MKRFLKEMCVLEIASGLSKIAQDIVLLDDYSTYLLTVTLFFKMLPPSLRVRREYLPSTGRDPTGKFMYPGDRSLNVNQNFEVIEIDQNQNIRLSQK